MTCQDALASSASNWSELHLLNDRTERSLEWDFNLAEHSPKISKWSLLVRAVVPVLVKTSGFVVNSRSIRVCEWFVMRVGADIICLRLLSSVICCSLLVSVERGNKLRLRSPNSTTFFRSDAQCSL